MSIVYRTKTKRRRPSHTLRRIHNTTFTYTTPKYHILSVTFEASHVLCYVCVVVVGVHVYIKPHKHTKESVHMYVYIQSMLCIYNAVHIGRYVHVQYA